MSSGIRTQHQQATPEPTNLMQTFTIPVRPQWYTREGLPVTEVPGADGKNRKPTLRDARQMGLVPDASVIMRVVTRPDAIPAKVAAVGRLALSRDPVPPELADPVLQELYDQADGLSSEALAYAAAWRGAVLTSLGCRQEPEPQGVDVWHSVQALRTVWLQNIRQVYWLERTLVSRKGYAVRADMLVEHRSCGITLVDLRTQGLPKPRTVPKPKLGWLEKLAAARQILGPGVRVCTLIASPDQPGTLWEVWCSPAHLQRATAGWKAALTLWQSLTGYHPFSKGRGTT
jgi:hypothetical protein